MKINPSCIDLGNRPHALLVAVGIGIACILGSGVANAAPIQTLDANVSSWNVGTGQLNGHFAVLDDTAFSGGAIQLGLRAEQRSVGAVTPSGNSYLVQPGVDPTNASRAWWNFQISIGYNGTIASLDSLTLTIEKDAGTNAGGGGGPFDLKLARPFIDDRHPPHSDGSFSDIYQIDQNPLFAPWFTPPYDTSANTTFAYEFTLTATKAGTGDTVVSQDICIHTAGLDCSPSEVAEPATLAVLGLPLVGLGFLRRRKAA